MAPSGVKSSADETDAGASRADELRARFRVHQAALTATFEEALRTGASAIAEQCLASTAVRSRESLEENLERYVSFKEAARLARVSPKTISRMAKRVPNLVVTVGDRRRVDFDLLARKLEASPLT
jgi:hypothetical protein